MLMKFKPNLEPLLARVVPSATNPDPELELTDEAHPAELETCVDAASQRCWPLCVDYGDAEAEPAADLVRDFSTVGSLQVHTDDNGGFVGVGFDFEGTGIPGGEVLGCDEEKRFDALDSGGGDTLGVFGGEEGCATEFEFNIFDWDEQNYCYNCSVDTDVVTSLTEYKIAFYYDQTIALLIGASETLSQKFAKTVEHFPLGWQVHHARMAALRERYAALGIDVDAIENLRGVHPVVHQEINKAQDHWRRQLMKEMKLDPNRAGDTKKFWETVDMKKVAEFEKRLEDTYGHLFLKTGATAADTKAVLKIIDGERKSRRFVAGMGKRWSKLFPAVTGLAIFSVLGEGVAMADTVVADPPEARAAWNKLESQYKGLIEKVMSGGRITYFEGQNFMTAWDKYLAAIQTPDDIRQKVVGAMRTWIDAHLHP